MKILLLGHKGFVGSYLYEHLSVDILSERDVYDNGEKYDYVINCIGRPNIGYCEKNIKETNYSNWLVIEDIIKYYPQAKIINFSTNAVYDGEGLNKEDGNTTDSYHYVKQKLKGEKLIQNGVTFRIGTLFGHKFPQPGKFIEYILTQDNLKLDSVLFNPSSMTQILKVINYELEKNIFYGIYNLSNLGLVSHYDFGIAVTEMLGLKKNIEKVDKLDRLDSNYGRYLMDLSKLNAIYPLTHWKEDSLIKI